MLSQSEKLSKLEEKKRILALPELERPRTVRLKFRKVGSLQYISHLDLQRTFMRVLTRACLPVWYTKGFNPHAKLVFSTPLSVGAQSEYEFLDLRIDREMSTEEIMKRLNRELTEELQITEAYLPKSDFSEIAWATYEIEICTEHASEALAEQMTKVLTTAPLLLTKRTKAGEKEIDIVPLIHEIKIRFNENDATIGISATLSATTGEFLNPEMLITALKRECSIMSGDPMKEWYTILRTSVMKADFTRFR
ncbi:MAG: DUF2344 domain-containing protein [Clostridia bacterium]|nr:DUF2344 domain-containing protein [Clostridia bacterium]